MSRAKGNLAEERACQYLQERGFAIVEQNFYSRFGEIDIIALRESVLHFIEVKSALDYESAVQNITQKKISRIIKTAMVYLKKNNLEIEYVFDAIIITPKELEMIHNITI